MESICEHIEAPEKPEVLKQDNIFFRFCMAYPDYDRESKAVAGRDGRDLRTRLKRSLMKLKRKQA